MNNKKVIVTREFNPNIVNNINKINILDVMNVRGYCSYDNTNNKIYTWILSDDIVKELGAQDESIYNEPATCGGAIRSHHYNQEIRWSRFNKQIYQAIEFFNEYDPLVVNRLSKYPVSYGVYIPLEIIVRVLMNLRNQKAKDFQYKLITYIVPIMQQQTYQQYIQEQMRNKYKEYYQTQIQDQQKQIQYQEQKIDKLEREVYGNYDYQSLLRENERLKDYLAEDRQKILMTNELLETFNKYKSIIDSFNEIIEF